MNTTLLELQDVSYGYERNLLILDKVSLQIPKGAFIGIIGPNGGGKTTLLRLIATLIPPLSGKYHLMPGTKIGYVPQNPKLDRDFPITTLAFILTGGVAKSLWFGRYPKEVKERAEYLLSLLHLEDHKNKLLGSLSGGLLQKALLARSLMADPELLLLDEPTSNVDFTAKQEIFDLLQKFQGTKTILVVTHDWKIATEYFPLLFCVDKGVSSIAKENLCKHFTVGLFHPLQEPPSL